MDARKLIIVTGANRGIGRAICQLLLSKPNSSPLTVIATSRRGDDLGLANPSDGDDAREVVYSRLEISSRESIRAFATEVGRRGKVYALINNAGVNLDAQYGVENAKMTLDVNYRGTLDMCKTFIPLLGEHGRIVNVSSAASSLSAYSKEIQSRFRDPGLTLDGLEALAQEYEHSVATSTEKEAGFFGPGRSYSVSKALMNGLTHILARVHPGLIINACCPGWVATDMGGLVGSSKVQPPKTPEQGAMIPVRLAIGDVGGVSGGYWANSSVRSKEESQLQQW